MASESGGTSAVMQDAAAAGKVLVLRAPYTWDDVPTGLEEDIFIGTGTGEVDWLGQEGI